MRRSQEREGDLPERPPGAGVVERRRFVHVGRDRLQAGEVVDHHRARRCPRVQPDERPDRRAGALEPRRVTADDVVEEPVAVEDVEHDRRDRDRRRDGREVERGPEEVPPADLLVDDERERQAERHLERHDAERVLGDVLEGDAKDGIVEDRVVVERPRVTGLLPEDSPVEEADVDRVAERVDEEEPEDGDRHRHEGVAPAGFTQAGAEHR